MKIAALALITVLSLGPLSPTPALADAQSVVDKTYDWVVKRPSRLATSVIDWFTVDKTYDALILRPLGGFGLLVGGALSVPTMLLASVNGREGIREVWEVFVEYPYESTVDREFGEF